MRIFLLSLILVFPLTGAGSTLECRMTDSKVSPTGESDFEIWEDAIGFLKDGKLIIETQTGLISGPKDYDTGSHGVIELVHETDRFEFLYLSPTNKASMLSLYTSDVTGSFAFSLYTDLGWKVEWILGNCQEIDN